jgi:putative addiction module component (TIGR02574 family)
LRVNYVDMPIETDLVERAMHLPPRDHAELALQLIRSLETDAPDENVEQEWANEIERRIGEFDRGEVEALDADDAIARAEASFKQGKQG